MNEAIKKRTTIAPGDVFATILLDGRFGAIKIINKIEKSYLIATTTYISESMPCINDKQVSNILRQNRFFYGNQLALNWCDGKLPKELIYIGTVPLSENEEKLKSNVYGGKWDASCGDEVFMEWRWANDRENYEKEMNEREEQDKKRLESLMSLQKPKKMMSDAEFWELISMLDWEYEGDDDKVVEPLINTLKNMKVKDIKEFQESLAFKLFKLDTRNHAEVLEPDGEISADYFLYSRCAVIANGEDYYTLVLNDSQSMPRDTEFESLLYVAQVAYELRTGKDFEYETGCSFETFSNKDGWKSND